MYKLVRLAFLLFSLTLISINSHALEIDNIQFEVSKLNDNVYVIGQDFGPNKINFGLVIGENNVSLISAMMKDDAPTIEKVIKTITQKPIKYVFNIDSDPFQHDANEYFASKGAIIIAHKNIKDNGAFTQLTFDKELSIDLGNEKLTLFHTPSHTKDNMIIHLENTNVIFMGDAFRNDWLMYSGPNGSTAHIQGLDFAIALSNNETKFVPGNRSSVAFNGVDELRKARNIYQNFVAKVKALHLSGMFEADITNSSQVREIVNGLERFGDFQKYIKYHVAEILENG